MEWEVYSSEYQTLSMLSLDPCLEMQSEGIMVRQMLFLSITGNTVTGLLACAKRVILHGLNIQQRAQVVLILENKYIPK